MIKGDDCSTQIIEYVCVHDCMFFCLILPFEVALHFHFEILTCLYPNKVCKTRRDPTANRHLFKWNHSQCDGISDREKM